MSCRVSALFRGSPRRMRALTYSLCASLTRSKLSTMMRSNMSWLVSSRCCRKEVGSPSSTSLRYGAMIERSMDNRRPSALVTSFASSADCSVVGGLGGAGLAGLGLLRGLPVKAIDAKGLNAACGELRGVVELGRHAHVHLRAHDGGHDAQAPRPGHGRCPRLARIWRPRCRSPHQVGRRHPRPPRCHRHHHHRRLGCSLARRAPMRSRRARRPMAQESPRPRYLGGPPCGNQGLRSTTRRRARRRGGRGRRC
mmetsp:Transcript_16928/g.57472  ORF Transcript_16928/g.57472 Transcript_16928/m.57472 type:complete len:253 (-) Transcript_16928:538-1296(-)